MKKQNIIVRTLKNRIRRNEEIWTTKKAEKALLQIAGVLAFMLITNGLINVALAYQPKIINIDNSLNSGVRQELESERNAPQDESEDDTLVQETIEEKINKVFGENGKIAYAIARSESGLKNVKGDTAIEFEKDGKVMGHSCGIFQVRVLKGRPTCEELMDVDTNIQWAKKIFDSRGDFTAWSNYNNQAYLKFLN